MAFVLPGYRPRKNYQLNIPYSSTETNSEPDSKV